MFIGNLVDNYSRN